VGGGAADVVWPGRLRHYLAVRGDVKRQRLPGDQPGVLQCAAGDGGARQVGESDTVVRAVFVDEGEIRAHFGVREDGSQRPWRHIFCFEPSGG